MHPGSGNRDGTMLNALLHHAPALAALPRAGIVHRLDKDTSGLMVVAKTLEAQTDLVRQLAARTVGREYLAVVHGDLARATTIDAPIGRHPTQRTSMAVVAGGKAARTHVDIVERFGLATLLRCRLETGTHASDPRPPDRARASAGGRPDVSRAPRRAASPRRKRCGRFARQALHAQRLGLVHPASKTAMQWESPVPDDFVRLIDALRAAQAAGGRRAMTATLARDLAAARLDWLVPQWSGPARVAALFTTRSGGSSAGAAATMDVGPAHPTAGELEGAIGANRRRLAAFLPAAPIWLSQVHGCDVVDVDARNAAALRALPPRADAAVVTRAAHRGRRPHGRLPAGALRRSCGQRASASRMPAGAASRPACSKQRWRR